MKFLSAPWRWKFISGSDNIKGCIFCKIPREVSRDTLICHLGENFFVILNKYPYTSGHLMIVPYEHLDSPDRISGSSPTELWELMNRSMKILKSHFSPHGFNVGMNIGSAAGAGVKDHFHLHIVPRWEGDSNYMGVIGDTKVVSYDIFDIFDTLEKEFGK